MQREGLDAASVTKLQELKWAFNAKPDFLIVSGNEGLLIEAKVESGIGKYGDGATGQQETQLLIRDLLVNFVPTFNGMKIELCTFGLSSNSARRDAFKPDYEWGELANCADNDEVDGFTRQSLNGLVAR